MKAAFVTGGGGYLGSKLCRELVRDGYSVTAYDLSFHGVENELQATGINRIHVSSCSGPQYCYIEIWTLT